MNDQQIEKEIVEKGKTAPRVTPDHIEGIIAQEAYFTAEDGAFGKAIKAKNTGGEVNYQPHESLSLLTFCVLVLRKCCKQNLDARRLLAEAEAKRAITP